MEDYASLIGLVRECMYESSLDKQIDMLYKINDSLPPSLRLKIPSLLTNDYLGRALDMIEENLGRYYSADHEPNVPTLF